MKKVLDLLFARDAEGIEKLIKSKEFDVNSYISLDRSALALSAACNYIDVMQCLITNGADVNLNNGGDLGYTPIEAAAREGSLDAIELLLKNGAEINKGNTINSNALIGACISAKNEVLQYLIKKGANINHRDNNGQTALHYICKFAKQWGSGVITETVDSVTRKLENPRLKKHIVIFNTLLQNGANVNLETNYGYTPLHLAAETDTYSFIMPLIEKGANINAQNSKGFSPLHAASDKGNLESAKILIASGADINIIDMYGFTPILAATSIQNIELVKLLIKKGAQKEIKAKVNYGNVDSGDDCISLAKKIGNKKLLKILE